MLPAPFGDGALPPSLMGLPVVTPRTPALQFGAGGDAHLRAVMLCGAPAVPVSRDKARLLAVEMGPWVPFQLSKQEQNPLSTGSARGPGARRPPVPSIVPRGSRAGCSWGQQHLWDLALALPLAALGCGLRGPNPLPKPLLRASCCLPSCTPAPPAQPQLPRCSSDKLLLPNDSYWHGAAGQLVTE